MTVKWLFADPYLDGFALARALWSNARFLVTSILYGEDWSVFFLPEGSNVPILLGLPALFLAGSRRRSRLRAAFVAVIALGALIPCSYSSFLWNRLRYLWPFAGAWFVMLACLAREVGDLARRVRPSNTFVTPLLCGLFVGALASRLPLATRDLVDSAAAVTEQQVSMARWAAENLPADARIGVNDAGAMAYLSGRRTFDVVGLTTEGEARYWVAGAGSRYEHYERTPREALPTHFIVYPGWMSCSPVLGDELWETTVPDSSILGGPSMIAYEARYDTLGSGALPMVTPRGSELVDELDVSDLESEEAHGYALERARDEDNQAALMPAPASDIDASSRSEAAASGAFVSDGGRMNRARDRFHFRSPGARPSTLILRGASATDVTLSVLVGAREVGVITIAPGPWVERSLELSPRDAGDTISIEVVARGDGRFSAFHYWLYASR
jgi:hypothetical protein